MPDPSVTHDAASRRFTAATPSGGTAVLEYEPRDGALVFTHTVVPEADEGEGIGSALVRAGLAHAREAGLSVVPQCPFVAAYVEQHPDTQDLVAG